MKVREAIRMIEDDGWFLVATREIRDAIRFHIEGLKTDGLPVPQPTSIAEYVDAG
jgi:predicted RNase H-like HicB family nuclease